MHQASFCIFDRAASLKAVRPRPVMSNTHVKVLALDLEGTLISNAVSVFPRPGLREFLDFCHEAFDKVVLFTSVPENRARKIIQFLADEDLAPAWFRDIEYVVWNGEYKDLNFVIGFTPKEVLLIDDQERYIHPEQKEQWLPIQEYVYPYSDNDQVLKDLERCLRSRHPC